MTRAGGLQLAVSYHTCRQLCRAVSLARVSAEERCSAEHVCKESRV